MLHPMNRRDRTAGIVFAGLTGTTLLLYPFLPPGIAGLSNLFIVIVMTAVGLWAWGLAASAWAIVVTGLMDALVWHQGFGPSVYLVGTALNATIAVVLGGALQLRTSQAMRDRLTGLYDQQSLRQFLDWEIERSERSGSAPALVMIDLDRFKELNDRHGHPFGDEVLRQTASTLKRGVRRADLVSRYGGDEFAVLMPGTAAEKAAEAVRRLSERLGREPVTIDDRRIGISFSAGVAVHRPGMSGDEMVEAADRALYRAKEAGRDTVRID